ncbi:unnamed protein product [Mytilus coruscus]|uniref:Uncharacterized protein n=1 Tax=Mytilus coruscus TaxID=42192 RepID=A0A6J8BQ70_MYTCO|nr:unnamed protein product [Mytilus coruscus]
MSDGSCQNNDTLYIDILLTSITPDTSPPVEAAIRSDYNSVRTYSTDNIQNVTENNCTIEISHQLFDLNANIVQPVSKPSSASLQSAVSRRPHFDKFKSYDDQVSTMESNAGDQVSYHIPAENLDDCCSVSAQSCQMYTCTPVQVSQGAAGASDPVEWISFTHKIATVLNIEPEFVEAHDNERPSFVSARF